MSANFEIKISNLFTTDVGDLKDVIKKVEFVVKGTDQGQSFELPKYCDLTEPQSSAFKPFEELTQDDVILWAEENFEDLDATKAHIQYVLDQQVAKAVLSQKTAPWIVPDENTTEQSTVISTPLVPDEPIMQAQPLPADEIFQVSN